MRIVICMIVTMTILMVCPLNAAAIGLVPNYDGIGLVPSQYVSHLPFIISQDSDFATYGFGGDGSPENPYIIENLLITSSGTSIEIEGIESSFIIRNCWLEVNQYYTGISLIEVWNAVVTDCWIQGGSRGISVERSVNVDIIRNTIVSNDQGIRSSSCLNVIYSDNIVVDNDEGITIDNAYNSTVIGNRIYANRAVGLSIWWGSYNNTITNNVLGWNDLGIVLLGENNAIDQGESNTWSGNHYSDYVGAGAYAIEGNANSTDESPIILEDVDEPILALEETIAVTLDKPSFQLSIVEDYPLYYDTKLGGGEWLDSGYYFDKTLNISLNGKGIGFHNITITLQDGSRNEASFDIEVEITEEADILPTIYAIIGIAVVGSIIIAMEVYHRRK